MSSARGIILEIKRRLGDVNASVPDETDILAYLNSALRGMWNYAIEIDSPRVEISESVTVDATGVVQLLYRPVRVTKVLNTDNRRELPKVSPRGASDLETWAKYRGMFAYYDTLAGLQIIQSSDSTGGHIRVSYYPEYQPLTSRESELPFASVLDDVVTAWTVNLITTGRSLTTSDMGSAGVLLSSLIEYLEGHSSEHYRGYGPW